MDNELNERQMFQPLDPSSSGTPEFAAVHIQDRRYHLCPVSALRLDTNKPLSY